MTATNTTCNFTVTDATELKKKMLSWANQFSIFCFLDNNHYKHGHHTAECLLAAGSKRHVSASAGNALRQLQQFILQKPAWLFGHIGYDIKNEIESPATKHNDHVGFPDIFFFEPEHLISLEGNELRITGDDPDQIYDQLINTSIKINANTSNVVLKERMTRAAYVDTINILRDHIHRGDCYEVNYCHEFFSEGVQIDPLSIYERLTIVSPNPFSAFYRVNDSYLLCASPERYLRKTGNKLISQPIKGTSQRFPDDKKKDEESRAALAISTKDRSENVMVVDLVRNDLSKVSVEGSVKVDELYGIYSFPQVYQMISTISGVKKPDSGFADIIRATFPMGSMTGAPKKKVMELIDQYEKSARGIFSGAVGYLTPAGDFDLNVVIRSIMYNAATKYLSFQVGSGITFASNAEDEYEECMLKALAMQRAIAGQ